MTNDDKKPDQDKKYSMEDLLNGIKTIFNKVEEKTPPTNDSPKGQTHIIEYLKENPVKNKPPKTKSSNSGGRGL